MPDFNQLPLILAGPIIRRVQPTLVSVWVALSQARTVELGIWTGITNAGTTGTLFGTNGASHTATTSSIQIGEKLHIALVTLDIADTGFITAFADAGGMVRVTSEAHGLSNGDKVNISETEHYNGERTVSSVTANTFDITDTWDGDDGTGRWENILIPPVPGPLIPGQIYSYNLVFDNTDDLNTLRLLENKGPATEPTHLALGFVAGQLPGFTLPALTLDNLKIAHGSCRKAHGHGVDGLAALDKMIERTLNEPFERPQQLFLTGDQIYADDIAIMLLPQLTTAGNALLGATEELPLSTETGEIKVAASAANFPTTWRQELVKQKAKFSSGEASSHALSFGEFCALYLFFWSNELWDDNFIEKGDIFPVRAIDDDCIDEDDLSIDDIIVNSVPSHLRDLYPDGKRKDLVEAWHELCDVFDDQLDDVKAFKKTLPEVRRALANIATYMIFDDHEVTDDWYLTQDWRDKVLTSPLGVTVLRNGLTSFALFQAWGNDPRRYQLGDHASLLTNAQSLITASGAVDTISANALDALYGFDGTPSKVKWHFSVPSGPTDTIVLDTRTRRTFDGRFTPPGLILSDDLGEQLPAEPSPGAELMIVVSPAPVLGLAAIEELAQPMLVRAKTDFFMSVIWNREPGISGYMEWDMEAWSLHTESFEALLARFNEMGKVLILSGDVHYGFSTEMDYWKKNQPEPARIIQLTASALKNEWAGGKRSLETVAGQEILHNAFYPMARLGWHDPLDLVGEVNIPGGAIPRRIRALLRQVPVVLPAHNWEVGSSISVEPDWVWQMSLVKDLRPDDDSPDARPSDGQSGNISPDINPANPVDGYIKVLERAEKQLKNKIARSVAFGSNLGLVSFSGTGTTLKVNHTLMYRHPASAKPDDPQAYTAYDISFANTSDPQPTIS